MHLRSQFESEPPHGSPQNRERTNKKKDSVYTLSGLSLRRAASAWREGSRDGGVEIHKGGFHTVNRDPFLAASHLQQESLFSVFDYLIRTSIRRRKRRARTVLA